MRKIVYFLVVAILAPSTYFVARNTRFDPFRDIAVKQGAWYDVRMYGAIAGDQISDVPAAQAACDSIASHGGGTLFFPPGQYEFYGDSIEVYSNTTIMAYGAVFNDTTGGAEFFYINGDSDITFLGGEWNGNADIDGGYTEFDHGITVIDGFRIWVEDVYMHDLAGDGIYFADTDYGTVTNSTIILNHLQDSPYIGRNCVAVVEGDNFVISDNILEGGAPANVDLESNAGLLVRNCVVSGNNILGGIYGIALHAEANAAARVDSIIVEGNLIQRTSEYGIIVQGAGRWQISNNTINSSGRQGIFVLDGSGPGKISGNYVYNSGNASALGGGIELEDSLRSISITDNEVSYSRRDGIKILGTSGDENKNLVITGNICWNNDRLDAGTESGIKVWYSDSSYIDNNFCYDDLASHTQLYGFSVRNCDNIFFGPGNWGYGNKTRLFEFSSTTKERIGGTASYTWTVDNIAQGVTNAVMKSSGGAISEITVPFDCQIVSLSVATSDTVDTESYAVNVFKNGVVANLTLTMANGTATRRYGQTTLLQDSNSDLLLVAGDRIQLVYTTHGSLAPNGSLDVSATVLVKY